MRFVIATSHFAGLGFALRLIDEGHEVVVAYRGIDDRRATGCYELVGNGLVTKVRLADILHDRHRYKNAYWIWDENHSVEENELLRAEGFRVLGGGAYANTMEHDRAACLEHVARYGLLPPPSTSFDDPQDALRFLNEHPETAYVYKPDRGENYETWLPESDTPEDANLELRQHLRSIRNHSPFVLQELKGGIETNVEVWFVRGQPRFAFMAIESKRKLAGDLGDLVGCAFDFAFVIPLESRAVCESIGRLFPAYAEMGYTGFGDANFIAARDGIWFFEKCERFGYNAHPNLLWNLNRDPLGDTFASLIDGTFTPNFSPGFGATCTMYMDHRAPGKVIQFPETIARDLYFYDVYRDDGLLLTAGYLRRRARRQRVRLHDSNGVGGGARQGARGEVPWSILPHRRRRHELPFVAAAPLRGPAGDGLSLTRIRTTHSEDGKSSHGADALTCQDGQTKSRNSPCPNDFVVC